MFTTSVFQQFPQSPQSLRSQQSQQSQQSQSPQQMRQQIRRQVRDLRRNLTALEQQIAEKRITEQALSFIERHNGEKIALYLSFDGEISTRLLIETLWQQKKSLYLPVLHPFSRGNLLFLRYEHDTLMRKNNFGIIEPKLDVRKLIEVNQLDIVFTPLVAFDSKGNRLGMGGGFYDRTLQNWQQKSFLPVGLAHQCQQVEALPIETWDIPLADILVG